MKYQLPPLLWIILVYILSVLRDLPLSDQLPSGSDKIAHALAFLVLCWLVRRAFYEQHTFELLRNKATLGALLFTGVYGVLDEFHRLLVPGHSPDMSRLVADLAGVLLYLAIRLILPGKPEGKGSEPES